MELNTIYNKHQLRSRILFMLMVIAIYFLGQNIPLPLVEIEESLSSNINPFHFYAELTGGNIATISLFSIGIGPYMSAMLIWRFISSLKIIDPNRFSQRALQQIQLILTLVIASIQAISSSLSITLIEDSIVLFYKYELIIPTRLLVSIVMVAGAFILIWLGNLNQRYGLGGLTIFILVGIIGGWLENIGDYYQVARLLDINSINKIFYIIGLLFIILVFINIVILRAERRIPMYQSQLSEFNYKHSYYPIKLNPAGGMPIMMGMSILVLPIYLLQILMVLYPNNDWLPIIFENIQLSTYSGVLLYISLIFVLSIGFSFITIDPTDTAESMQKAGSYFPNIRPGIETRNYISYVLMRVATVGALYVTAFSAVPLLFSVSNPEFEIIAMFPGQLLLVIALLNNISDQILALLANQRYRGLLDDLFIE